MDFVEVILVSAQCLDFVKRQISTRSNSQACLLFARVHKGGVAVTEAVKILALPRLA